MEYCAAGARQRVGTIIMLEMKKMQKLAAVVNTVLIGCFIMGLVSFRLYGMTYMFYHCIPTIALLISFYYLLYKQLLHVYVTALYAVVAIYMAAGTLCVGYDAGFHLYCTSLIPLAFYMEYMAYKLQTKKMSALAASLVFVAIYLVTSGYAVTNGPLYPVDAQIASRFLYVNAIIVFSFLISYANLMLKLIVASEDKLTDMAHTDRLTGLFNRHYMMSHLDALYQSILPRQWLAMVDIDDFKMINDTYGHNCGDYVLTELTKIMLDVCRGCTISRWGGEEFLAISNASTLDPELMETLRQRVESAPLSYQGKDFSVTITIGVSLYQPGQSLSAWIQSADTKLYDGKASGKNRVVY